MPINWHVVRINLEHYAAEIDGDIVIVTDDVQAIRRIAERDHGANYIGTTIVQDRVDIRKYCSGVVKIKQEVDRGDS